MTVGTFRVTVRHGSESKTYVVYGYNMWGALLEFRAQYPAVVAMCEEITVGEVQ